eukprot:7675625-Pyramimonas_sp.AAC.1
MPVIASASKSQGEARATRGGTLPTGVEQCDDLPECKLHGSICIVDAAVYRNLEFTQLRADQRVPDE